MSDRDSYENRVKDFESVKASNTMTNRPFINTATGTKFYLDHINPDDIHIADIAHALSNICRFNGHTSCHYSVAAHSLLVEAHCGGDLRGRMGALLHDAAEAYICDIPSPVKPLLGKPYADLYAKIQGAINQKYGIRELPYLLDAVDTASCVLEAEALFGYTPLQLEANGFDVDFHRFWAPWDTQEVLKHADEETGYMEAEFLCVFEKLEKAILSEVKGN